jgi:hypothetical protein
MERDPNRLLVLHAMSIKTVLAQAHHTSSAALFQFWYNTPYVRYVPKYVPVQSNIVSYTVACTVLYSTVLYCVKLDVFTVLTLIKVHGQQ